MVDRRGGDIKETVVLLPFESGNVAEVEVTSYEARQSEKPVRAYFAHDVTPQMSDTLKIGADIAYRLGYERGEIDGESFGVSCTLRGFPAGISVKGESSGLAMAIAVYAELTRTDVGRVAATGVLSSLKGDGKIGPVLGIEQKLAGALARLRRGDIMLYPLANGKDVSEDLKAKYRREGITLVGVASAREALTVLCREGAEVGEKNFSHRTKKNNAQGREKLLKDIRKGSRAVFVLAVFFFVIMGVFVGKGILKIQNDKNSNEKGQAVTPEPHPDRTRAGKTIKYVFE